MSYLRVLNETVIYFDRHKAHRLMSFHSTPHVIGPLFLPLSYTNQRQVGHFRLRLVKYGPNTLDNW
jgi:hypothetical protein